VCLSTLDNDQIRDRQDGKKVGQYSTYKTGSTQGSGGTAM